MTKPIRPEDLLPDDTDIAELGGVLIRKGSAGAFVQNVLALGRVEPGSADEQAVLAEARAGAANLKATGFFEVLALRDERVAELLGLNGS